MIVRNMTGGASTIAPNYVYGSKPDGLTTLLSGSGVYTANLLELKAARYELVKMPSIVAWTSGTLIAFASTRVVDKPENILKAKGAIYGGSNAAPSWQFLFAKELLNIPTEKVVLGYSSGPEYFRALVNGEVNLVSGDRISYENMARQTDITAVFQAGILDEKGYPTVRDPDLPTVITFKELYEKLLGKSPSGPGWEAFKTAAMLKSSYANTLFLPPGTPDSIVSVYWDTADKLVKDAEFLKGMDPLLTTLTPKWKTGEALNKEFSRDFSIEPQVLDWLKGTLAKYGLTVE